MVDSVIDFIKETRKIFVILFIVIAMSFWVYNAYLVDKSLSNLKFILTKIDKINNLNDAKELSSFLNSYLFKEIAPKGLPDAIIAQLESFKNILIKHKGVFLLEEDTRSLTEALQYVLFKEITNKELLGTGLIMTEIIKDILAKLETMSQIEDAKFILGEIIKYNEVKRPAVLLTLDRINNVFGLRVTRIPRQRLKKQLKILKGALGLDKDRALLQDGYYTLGNIYLQLLEFVEAKEAYRKAIDLNPKSDLAQKSQFNLGWTEKIQGNLDEAIKEFRAFSQTVTQEEIATFSQYQISDALSKKEDYDEAITVYQQLIAKHHSSDLAQLAYFQIGYNYLYNIKDYGKTREALEEAKSLFKDYAIAAHIENKMIPYIVMRYNQEGFRLLKAGYKSSSPENHKRAQEIFDKALEINPENGISYSGKALAALWLKDSDKALRYGRKAVRLLPYNEIVSVNLGYIYTQLKLVDEAIKEYKRFISVNPFTSRGYYNLGCAYAIQNKFKEAALVFHEATQIDPKFSSAFNNQALCLWQMERFAEAIETFKKAEEANPNFLDALFNLGSIYKIVGRYIEAKEKFEKILEIDPTYADAKNQLRETEKIIQQMAR